ncbi:MAG: anthranilate synthase component II [Coriobacteriales bacterium]|jgi:anthranilate synthase component 2
MIVLIDNYDSFSYNLYQLIGVVEPDIKVLRNDAVTVDELETMKPEALILSPGPGRPEDAGICIEAVQKMSGKIPILGVCLGHQAICMAFGGSITYAKELMHGKSSLIGFDGNSKLFRDIKVPAKVGRYHSLEIDPDNIPKCLRVTATSDNGEIMAVEHVEHPTFGLQFHPESILTPQGDQIIRNFIDIVRNR